MYGRVIGTSTGSVGAALLPNTGSNRPLFYTAFVLLVAGVVTLAVSSLMAVKNRKAEV